MSTKTRIYVVGGSGLAAPRLVKAATQAQAFAHVVDPLFTIEIAPQDALVELLAKGVQVETAGAAPQQG